MITSLSLILLCQLVSEVAVRGLGLPMPEPVIGLVLLLLLLRDRFALLVRAVATAALAIDKNIY
jgi:holin-like protein